MAKPVQGRRCPATVSALEPPWRQGSGARSPSQDAMSEPSCERDGITMAPRFRSPRLLATLLALLLLLSACEGAVRSTIFSNVGEQNGSSAQPTAIPPSVYPLKLTDDA